MCPSAPRVPAWFLCSNLRDSNACDCLAAYAYAPATKVAPLGAVTVVSNCIIAHYVLKESVRKRNIFGVVLALIGAVFIVTYAPDSQKQLTMELLEQYMMEPSFVVFIICILLSIAGLFMCVACVRALQPSALAMHMHAVIPLPTASRLVRHHLVALWKCTQFVVAICGPGVILLGADVASRCRELLRQSFICMHYLVPIHNLSPCTMPVRVCVCVCVYAFVPARTCTCICTKCIRIHV